VSCSVTCVIVELVASLTIMVLCVVLWSTVLMAVLIGIDAMARIL
jgi:hypothetical protein